jgi:hypothetical protein
LPAWALSVEAGQSLPRRFAACRRMPWSVAVAVGRAERDRQPRRGIVHGNQPGSGRVASALPVAYGHPKPRLVAAGAEIYGDDGGVPVRRFQDRPVKIR